MEPPSNSVRLSQSRKRLKKYHSFPKSKALVTTGNTMYMAQASSLIKGKRQKSKCSFCSVIGHNTQTCPKRSEYRHEYNELTTDQEKRQVISRIDLSTHSFPVNMNSSTPVGNLTNQQYKSHFILHQVLAKNAGVNTKQKKSIQNDLVADVSFLSYGAQLLPENEHIITTGDVLLKLVMGMNSSKIMYDGTLHIDNWTRTNDMSKTIFQAQNQTSETMKMENNMKTYEL